MPWIFLLFFVIPVYGAVTDDAGPKWNCSEGIQKIEGSFEIIKSPDYPHQYPAPLNCTWKIEGSPNHWTKITVSEFEVGYSDSMRIEEILMERPDQVIPREYLHGSLTKESLVISSPSNRSVLIHFIGITQSYFKEYRFHLEVERHYGTSQCNQNVLNIGEEPKNYTFTFDSDKTCSKMLIAPENATIELDFADSPDHSDYSVNDLKELQKTTELFECPRTDYAEKAIYRSASNRVILRFCQSWANVSFTAKAIQRDCKCHGNQSLVVPDTRTTLSFGTWDSNRRFEGCEKIDCFNNITTVIKENATHYPVFSFDCQAKPTSPVTFNMTVPGFPIDVDQELFHFVLASHRALSLQTSNFSISIVKGAANFRVTTQMMPKDCVCFDDKVLKDVDEENSTFSHSYSRYCTPMDCFVKIKNQPGRNLMISTRSDELFEYDEHLWLLYGGDFVHNLGTTGDFNTDYLTEAFRHVKNIYLHLHIPSYHSKSVNVSENQRSSINFTIQWRDACTCDPIVHDLANGAFAFTSPFFPNNYCDNFYCQYKFKAPEGSMIDVNVLMADLDWKGDSLVALDKNGTNKMFLYNGTHSTFHDEVTIIFITDQADTGTGFLIEVKPVKPRVKHDHKGMIICVIGAGLLVSFLFFGLVVLIKRVPRRNRRVFVSFENQNFGEGRASAEVFVHNVFADQ